MAYGWRVGSKLDELSYVCEISQTEAYKLTLEKRGFGENTLISNNACTLQTGDGRQCCRHNVEDYVQSIYRTLVVKIAMVLVQLPKDCSVANNFRDISPTISE